MVQYYNYWGGWKWFDIIKVRGLNNHEGGAGQIKNSHFSLSQLNKYLYNISDVTKMHCTHDF